MQMADQILDNVQILTRNDAAANFASENPVLGKGEIAVSIDASKIKIGDGVKSWNQLSYVNLTPEEAADFGAGDMLKSTFATNSDAGDGYVDKAKTADKLGTQRSIAISGDVAGTANFDGSANASIVAVFANSGVTAGTYPKVTVDAKGRVTGGANLAAADVPNLPLSKITDAGTAASKNTGTSSGSVPVLGPDGKLPSSVFPALPAGKTVTVTSQAAMLALSDAVVGDHALRTDTNEYYVLSALPAATLSNWIHISDEGVKSVNGETGPSVLLDTDNIGEGATNKYYTESRFNSAFAAKSSSELSDGATILRSGDTLIINCGGASA
jgi:hypothetical protein